MIKQQKLVDHLFRHQFGRMVSILTRIFGLSHLQTIEDAVQDTFMNAMMVWRNEIPENPEAWLTKAAKNRAIDLLRKIKADDGRAIHFNNGPAAIHLNELFLEHEIEDSQLRMVFTACHPILNPKDQIAFALKTISGFGTKEIAAALLIKEETIKKRLSRARKTIADKSIKFEIPGPKEMPERLERVLEVIYLTFNEGFHSTNKKTLIKHDLCGEAIRLAKLLLKKESMRSGQVYALFALMCFHASRLDSRVNEENEILDLKNQDRSKWHFPLIRLGNEAMNKAVEDEPFSTYHYEAAIAGEHTMSKTFEATNWYNILDHYDRLYALQQSPFTLLNKSIVLMQLEQFDRAKKILDELNPKELEQRVYLYYGAYAEYFKQTGRNKEAIQYIDMAIDCVANDAEKSYLVRKKQASFNE